jgi:hypothetical protein
MKDLLQEYATYNLLANQKITQAILGMEESLHQQLVVSSFLIYLQPFCICGMQKAYGFKGLNYMNKSWCPV